MTAILILVAVFGIPSLIWFVWEVTHAPKGYEDEQGFHYEK